VYNTFLHQGYRGVKFFKFKKKNADKSQAFFPKYRVFPCGITHSTNYIVADKKSVVNILLLNLLIN